MSEFLINRHIVKEISDLFLVNDWTYSENPNEEMLVLKIHYLRFIISVRKHGRSTFVCYNGMDEKTIEINSVCRRI